MVRFALTQLKNGRVAVKEIIVSRHAPAAIGPYSQAVQVQCHNRDLLFLSGQIAIDPETGTMVQGDIAAETKQVMANLKSILRQVGATFDNLVKTTIYLVDLSDFDEVNRTYGSYFSDAPPARATVEVSRLPKDARVEIEGVAVV